MKLKNTYFILRHGQTIYQTKKKEFTYPPLPKNIAVKLTDKGKRQIEVAAKSLKKIGPDLIFSSDFFRARQTAEIVAKTLGINKIYFDKRLRDINLGIYHGGLKDNFYQDFPKYFRSRFYLRPPQGESWLECQNRMLNFFKKIDKRYKGKNILIVSHGDPLWLLEGAVKNWSLRRLLSNKINDYIKVGEFRQI